MVKLLGHDKDGRALFMFIIEQGNIEKLKQGHPIEVSLTEMDSAFNADVVIHFSADLLATVKEIAEKCSIGKWTGYDSTKHQA